MQCIFYEALPDWVGELAMRWGGTWVEQLVRLRIWKPCGLVQLVLLVAAERALLNLFS